MKKQMLSTYGRRVGRRYDSYAKEYDELYRNETIDDEHIFRLIKLIPQGGMLLDVGCGMGKDVAKALSLGLDVVGIDVSEEMLIIAKKHNPSAKFYLMDAINLDFEKGLFDGVMALYSLIYLSSDLMKKAIKEMSRVLKLGGYLLIIQHEGDFEGELKDLMVPDKTLYRVFKPRSWLEEELIKAGFEIEFSISRELNNKEIIESSNIQSVIIGRKE